MKRLMTVLVAALVGGCLLRQGAKEPGTRYVDSFDLSGASCGMGRTVGVTKSVDGNPLTIAGVSYAHGFGARPESAVGFRSNGKVTALDAFVGIDDDSEKAHPARGYGKPTAEFRVIADGKIVWRSPMLVLGDKAVAVHAELTGAREIVLATVGGGKWTSLHRTNGDWADARFSYEAGAVLEPIVDPAATRQLGILTPPVRDEPSINGADIWGVRPGHPVIFRVATSGIRPIRFAAKNLPSGVTFDTEKGILGGTAPMKAGAYDIEVTAENAKGKATRTIRLQVGETIALTPPMGWNSWNVFCYRLTQQHAADAARAMEESGLGDHGWSYVNLDDWWEMNNSGCPRVEMRKKDFGGREDVVGPARDASGKILPNRSFPDMKVLTDTIHSYGFKAGLYSSPGEVTCGMCEGSLGHELQDAESWADWGFDYVKYDWCSYGKVFTAETGGKSSREAMDDPAYRESYVKPYRLMGDCLRRQKRDIVYSLCQYGMSRTQEWVRDVGGNCWRSWDDLKDGWTWMEQAIESRIGGEYHKTSGPGCWADPDMMIIGRQYSFGYDHMTLLTPNEQYTHVSIWAMVGSPLLTGCDLTKLDDFTRSLLINDDVIAISQDRLGIVARRIRHNDAESVWVRPLANGDLAVALVNRHPLAREIRVGFEELGLDAGDHWVKDCWRRACEGRHSGSYAADVPPHATKLIRIKTPCRKCE